MAQIEKQKKNLKNSSPSLLKIAEDDEILQKITTGKEQLRQQIRLAELELKKIKKENLSLERQIKIQ